MVNLENISHFFVRSLRAASVISSLTVMSFATSCGGSSKDVARENPLLQPSSWDTPFGIAPFEDIKPQDYTPAFEKAFADQLAVIDSITRSSVEPSFESVILPLDNSGAELADVFNIFTMVEAADTSDALAKINSEMMPRMSAHADSILLNQKLFARIKVVYDMREEAKFDAEQLRLVEQTYNQFVRGGALLSAEEREELSKINAEISELQVSFSQNVLNENNSFVLELKKGETAGLPFKLIATAKQEAKSRGIDNGWVITLQPSQWIPFMMNSERRDLREKLYKGYLSRGANGDKNDNREIIAKVMKLRQRKAEMLGYDNYASYVISDQMASTPKAAYDLLDQIWTPALERAGEELKQMEEFFREDHKDDNATFESWDWWFYGEKLRKKSYSIDEEMLRPYFSIDNVRNGAFWLANRLYGITFRPIIAPQYNEDCKAYEVLDNNHTHLGVLYFDLYARPTKGQGAWCGYFREQRYEGDKRIAPIVGIVCNFAKPLTDHESTLLTLNEVETLFHEFGHALHFLFHDVKYRGLSEVEGDFVELPSQIMENWALQPELLRMYAIHYRNNTVIPEEIIEKIQHSMLFNQGFMTTELAAAALLDLDLHTATTKELDALDVMEFEREALRTKRGMIPQIEPRYHLPYFSHLFTFDYASGYYFYLWAEVLDKDAYQAFKESTDIFDRKIAESFRRNILARGGSEDGMTMYRKFRGAEPSRDALLISRGLMEPPVDSVALKAAAIDSLQIEKLDSLKR